MFEWYLCLELTIIIFLWINFLIPNKRHKNNDYYFFVFRHSGSSFTLKVICSQLASILSLYAWRSWTFDTSFESVPYYKEKLRFLLIELVCNACIHTYVCILSLHCTAGLHTIILLTLIVENCIIKGEVNAAHSARRLAIKSVLFLLLIIYGWSLLEII